MNSNAAEVRRNERAWQDETGWTYQERAHAQPGTRYVLERQFERIREALACEPGHVVVDLGCGTGFFVDWLARNSPGTWWGVDLSRSAVRRARERNAGIALAAGDAEHLPFRSGMFDRVVCNGSAHHFLDLDRAMSEAYRILAPGGRLVLFEPIATPLGRFIRRGLFPKSRFESPADLAHKHEFDRRAVEESIARCGFTGTQAHHCDFLAYPLTGMYMTPPWSAWEGLFRFLHGVESTLDRWSPLRPVYDGFSWRLLVQTEKSARS